MNKSIKKILKWLIVLFPIFIANIRPSIIWIVISSVLYFLLALLFGLKVDLLFRTSLEWRYCILGLLFGIVCNFAFFDAWIPSGKVAFISSIFGVPPKFFLAIICIVIDACLSFALNILLSTIQCKTNTDKDYRENILDDVTFMNRGGYSPLLLISMVIYLYLPIGLFLLGWINPWLSIPVFLLMILGVYFFINGYRPYLRFNQSQITVFLLYFIIAVCFFLFCGHGDLMPQDGDWSKHHAILYDLMNYDWPVVYDGNAMLTYYIGQYIVPASIGKIMLHSKAVVNISTLFWNSFGLALVLCFLDRFFKPEKFYQKIILVLFVLLWGGAINLGAQFYNDGTTFGSFKWLDMGYIRVHFASNFDALRGSFQHVIVPWISCCILLIDKEKIDNYVLIALPLLFSSTFGFLYFVVMLLSLAVYKVLTYKDKRSILRQMFSKQNLLLLPTSAILLMYFSGNFLSDKPNQFGFGLLNFFVSVKSIKFLLIFILFEFGLYVVLLYKDMKRNVLFYIVVIELLIIPFITMGEWNDLCSRGGIPARFILMVMCIAVLRNKSKVSLAQIGIIFLVSCSALNILVQSCSILLETKNGRIDKSYIRNSYESYNGYAENPDVRIDDAYNYYTLDYNESLFKKIAKK